MYATFAFNWSRVRGATLLRAARRYAYDANKAQALILCDVTTKLLVKCRIEDQIISDCKEITANPQIDPFQLPIEVKYDKRQPLDLSLLETNSSIIAHST